MILVLNNYKTFRLIFFIICFCICLYQIIKICEMYFSYKTVVSMSYQNPSLISLPGLTLCIAKTLLIKPQYLNQIDENINRSDPRVFQFINNSTIGDQVKMMYSIDQIFTYCVVLAPIGIETDEQYINCSLISPIRQSINGFSLCYTLFHQTAEDSYEKFQIRSNIFSDTTLYILHIDVNKELRSYHLWLHSRDELIIRFPLKNSIEYSYKKGFVSNAQYSKQVVESLPKPYETNCFDYKTIKYKSRMDCIQNCRVRELRDNFEGWPSEYLEYNLTDNSDRIYKLWSKIENKTNFKNSLDAIIGEKCRKSCNFGTECRKENFEIRIMPFPSPKDFFRVFFTIPEAPDMLIRHSPKLIFEEFVSFIGSLIGIYFGFSVMMLTDVCSLAVNYCSKTKLVNYITRSNNKVINYNFKIHPKIIIQKSDSTP